MKFSFENFFSSILKPETLIDPHSFNDPLALKTSWEPLKQGGSSFRTHKGIMVRSDRYEFKPTTFMKIFSWIFIVVPLIAFAIFLRGYFIENEDFIFDSNTFWIGFIFMLFIGVGVYLVYKNRKCIIFDKNYGYYWKGKRNPIGLPINPSEEKESVQLSEIHALQIVHEWVISSSSKTNKRYKSFELNLVLQSGERINVIDHGNQKKLLDDANQLALFLKVPLWARI